MIWANHNIEVACAVAICAVLLFLYSVYMYAAWSVHRQRTAVCRAIVLEA